MMDWLSHENRFHQLLQFQGDEYYKAHVEYIYVRYKIYNHSWQKESYLIKYKRVQPRLTLIIWGCLERSPYVFVVYCS